MTFQEIYDLYMKPFVEDRALMKRIEEGIEQNRKRDGHLRLVDAEGKPLSCVRVRVNQTSHEFRQGANMLMLDEFKDEGLNAMYRDTFHQYFKLGTVPFYWNTLEPTRGKPRYAADSEKIYRRPAPDLCVNYCEEKGIEAKLHCLVYEAYVPQWLKELSLDEVKAAYEQRFAEIAERYADKMYEIEVINEVLCIPDVLARTSALASAPELVPWAFEMANKYFPHNTLVFNETVRWHRIGKSLWTDKYPLLLENAMLKGARFDKIGIQSHLFVGCKARNTEEYDREVRNLASHGDVKKMLTSLDVLGKFGLPLEVTEITIPTFGEGEEHEQLQADMLKLWYSAYFSHPLVDTVVYWNTADGHAFGVSNDYDENRCRGGLFHKDMSPKKSALMLKHLFEEEWHTALTLQTDADGYIDFRGFCGDYEICTDAGVATFSLSKDKENTAMLTIA